MNRRSFFAAALATSATMLTGCVAFVRNGKQEHIVRIPKTTPVGGVITMVKIAEDKWILYGTASDRARIE